MTERITRNSKTNTSRHSAAHQKNHTSRGRYGQEGAEREKEKLKLIKYTALVAFLAITTTAIVTPFLNASLNYTPVEFNPIHVQSFGYDVYADDGTTLLGSVDANTPAGHFVDGNHLYPRVDCGYSQSYLSDANGNPIGDTDVHEPIARFVVDGKVLFYHEYYYSTQYWARTYYNGDILDGSVVSWLDPLNNHPYARGGGTGGGGTLSIGTTTYTWDHLPRGCLAGILDTGTSPWGPNYASGAAITCGIVPVDYVCGGSPVRAGYSFNEQIAKLTTDFGNRKVIVRPWQNLAALSEFITFTYTTTGTLPNGTQATITATETSGKCGFMSVARTDDDSMKGAVKNYFPNNEQVDIPIDQQTVGKSNAPQTGTSQTTPKVEATGSLQYAGPGLDRTTTGAAQPLGISCPTLSGTIPSLTLSASSLDDFALPTGIRVVPGYVLQPITKIGVTQFDVEWSFYHFDGAGFDTYAVPYDASCTIEVPTSIESTNTYASSVATYKLGFISENELQVVTSSGSPIDPSLFTDFELTSFVGDPTANEYDVSVSQINPNGFSLADFETVMIWICVVLGLIVVIALVIKFKGSQAMQQLTQGFGRATV